MDFKTLAKRILSRAKQKFLRANSYNCLQSPLGQEDIDTKVLFMKTSGEEAIYALIQRLFKAEVSSQKASAGCTYPFTTGTSAPHLGQKEKGHIQRSHGNMKKFNFLN